MRVGLGKACLSSRQFCYTYENRQKLLQKHMDLIIKDFEKNSEGPCPGDIDTNSERPKEIGTRLILDGYGKGERGSEFLTFFCVRHK